MLIAYSIVAAQFAAVRDVNSGCNIYTNFADENRARLNREISVFCG